MIDSFNAYTRLMILLVLFILRTLCEIPDIYTLPLLASVEKAARDFIDEVVNADIEEEVQSVRILEALHTFLYQLFTQTWPSSKIGRAHV